MDTSDAAAPAVPALTSSAFSSVFQAIGGLRNRRALVALLSCLVAGVVVAMLLGLLGGFGRVLAALVWIVAVGTGVNAAGVILMDQARGVAPRRLSDALVYGLMCIPKLILLGLCLLLVAITVFIVIALVLLICKIPYLGPLVFVVAFPVSVLVAGLTFFGLLVGSVLALPAIWEGLTVTRAIAQALAIARTRGVEALLLLAMLWLLCLFVGFIVFGVLGSGLMPTVGLSAAILGAGAGAAGMESLAGVINGYGGGGYVIAAAIGLGLLWALATTLLGQVWLLGLAIVYLRVTEGLDAGATEAALLRGLDDAKRRAAELGEKARAKAAAAAAAARERDARESRPGLVADPEPSMTPAMAAAPTAAAPMATTPTATTPMSPVPTATVTAAPLAPTAGPTLAPRSNAISCPSCGAACTTDDLFCGVCGQRLK